MRSLATYLFLLLTASAYSQPLTRVITNNNLSLRLGSDGMLKDSSSVSSIVNKTGMGLLQSAGVWMSATDSLGQVRLTVYDAINGGAEMWPGPMTLVNEQAANSLQWNKVYPLTKVNIIYHIQNYNKQQYLPISEISNWPGSFGFPYAQILAPFVDLEDNNMVYEPLKGDYPYIESDAILYSISNDVANTHSISNGLPLGVELHTTVMSFNDPILSNCFMVRYTVFNRSPRTYKNFRFSPVLNFKIGSIENEYLGTEIGAQAIYAINDTSEATFSKKLVSLGCMALNKHIVSSMYFENNADRINGRPDSVQHFVNLMQGKWKNGKVLNFGSNGVDGSGVAKYVYSDTTDNSHSNLRWTDQVPGKKIGLLNFEAIELKSGQGSTYDLVYFSVDENFKSFKQIGENCLRIRQVLNTKNLLKTERINHVKASILTWFPNPVKIGDKLNLQTTLESPDCIRLMDLNGKEICKLNLDDKDKSIILPPDLNAGVYIVEYKTLNIVHVQKLILTH